METQNKTFTIHRAFNVECTEANLESQQTVWRFYLEKYLSPSGILATNWRKKFMLIFIVLFCLIFMCGAM